MREEGYAKGDRPNLESSKAKKGTRKGLQKLMFNPPKPWFFKPKRKFKPITPNN